jgi:hypothetical protein
LGVTHSVLGLNEGIVDGNDLDVGVLDRVAEDNATDAAETVDTDLDSHVESIYFDFVELEGGLCFQLEEDE